MPRTGNSDNTDLLDRTRQALKTEDNEENKVVSSLPTRNLPAEKRLGLNSSFRHKNECPSHFQARRKISIHQIPVRQEPIKPLQSISN